MWLNVRASSLSGSRPPMLQQDCGGIAQPRTMPCLCPAKQQAGGEGRRGFIFPGIHNSQHPSLMHGGLASHSHILQNQLAGNGVRGQASFTKPVRWLHGRVKPMLNNKLYVLFTFCSNYLIPGILLHVLLGKASHCMTPN